MSGETVSQMIHSFFYQYFHQLCQKFDHELHGSRSSCASHSEGCVARPRTVQGTVFVVRFRSRVNDKAFMWCLTLVSLEKFSISSKLEDSPEKFITSSFHYHTVVTLNKVITL